MLFFIIEDLFLELVQSTKHLKHITEHQPSTTPSIVTSTLASVITNNDDSRKLAMNYADMSIEMSFFHS